MVFLSLSRLVRVKSDNHYWRAKELFKYSQHFRGRKNRCYGLAVRAVRRSFVYATKARHLRRRNMRTLWITRATAGILEHGLKYSHFKTNLLKTQVMLNRKMLADLSITEPRTFKSLAALAKRRGEEGFLAALDDGKEPTGIFSRVVHCDRT
ncbi:large ribosomal subunit protein bL20m [Petromyzon marinus]|uniref:Large ribosomal subunit protein bL20m n=1 Tax=Petromyzon marinus TaxID=7757 RepID=A0AAJ7X1K9_PETMA|nr:39S ribosomal protein L20, mitochondrial [Petromyzon marinus]